MANLVTTTDQLKQYNSAVQHDADFNSFGSFELDAQINYLVPAIGQATYDAISADSLSGALLNAQTLFRKAEVNFMLGAWVNFGSVQIGESGLHVIQDEKRKIASDKKVAALRKQCFLDAYTALEAGVNYLENNIGSFTDYAASPQHAQNRSRLINTTLDFNRFIFINQNAQLFSALGPVIDQCEKQYIAPALGKDFTDALRTAILNNTTVYSIDAALQKKLMDAIGCALALFTIAEAVPFRMIDIEANGVITNSVGQGGMSSGNTELQEPANMGQLQMLMNKCLQRGEDNLARLRQFLNDNAGSFTDYTAVDTASSSKINDTERGIFLI